MPLLRASAMSFFWPTTVSLHFELVVFACMVVFDWSIIRRDDSILSQSTFEAGNPAFLAVASRSGISQHVSFERVNCPVAWEFFSCSALLTFIVPAVLMFGILLFFVATGGSYLYCVSWFEQLILQYVDISATLVLFAWTVCS